MPERSNSYMVLPTLAGGGLAVPPDSTRSRGPFGLALSVKRRRAIT